MSLTSPVLVSLQVGLPQHRGTPDAPNPLDRAWFSGYHKQSVAGPRWLGPTNLQGDGQGDLRNHGGPDKVVLSYAASHYPDWCRELDLPHMPYGSFGENFTVEGQTESDVCIGDIYSIGEARVEVAQPRQPCWKIARHWRIKDLSFRVQNSGRTGWYFRVLTPGHVAPGQPLLLTARPCPEWSVARVNGIIHSKAPDWEEVAALAELPLLAVRLRETLARRLAERIPSDPTSRLLGPNE